MKKIIFPIALCCFSFTTFSVASPQHSETENVSVAAEQIQEKEDWKKFFGNDLFDAEGKKVPVNKAVKKKYLGIYGSASWCGPCKLFTPRLIQFYEKNKNKLDIVLIGYHWTKEDVSSYMKKYKMPWAGTYRTENVEEFIQKYKIEGIPDFRLFNSEGELLISNGYNLEIVQKFLDEN